MFNNIFKSKTLLAALFVALFSTSCIDDADNLNPDEASDEMMKSDNLKAGSFFRQMERSIAPFHNADGNVSTGDYEITQAFNYDALGGYVACTHSNAEWNSLYAFREQARKALFDAAYVRVMSPWNEIHKLAVADNLTTLDALASVVKVAGMHRAADTFGALTYVNYGSTGNYDSLKDIYTKFFEELDEAITVLTTTVSAGNTTMLETYDIVYGGDLTKWLKFANTLRLRLAMRCSYVDATLARTQAEKAVASSAGLVESQADRFEIRHDYLSYNHPYVEVMGWGEARPAASIIAYMNGFNDPRRSVYFTAGADGNYNGVRVGLNTSNVSAYRSNTNLSNLNVVNSTPIVLMFASESYFLRAEGAIRGWNMGGSAEDLYKTGVETSFAERGNVSGLNEYLNSDATPGTFTDVVRRNNYTIPSTITPKWDDSADFETKLERIIVQKWIAGYLEGCEAWADQRRTGYPKLVPVASNASNGTIDSNIGPRRIPYPDQEYIDNAAGVASGVALLGGPDNGGTKVWWDKK